MPTEKSESMSSSELRQQALSRWDNEGGAGPNSAPQNSERIPQVGADIPQLTNAELVQMRIRIIAIENIVVALLARASDEQLGIVREMAANIVPRPGFTHHPLTIRAATQMIDLVHRAEHFRPEQP